ncbi:MAG TPA: tRNA epoxyqueuosine(34) reductase QueG [Gemmatimonadaceae bacterium]|nr:tRNA epoxyqueuosine(34) reductase QueG [Gemmatimonadaceae bacterium]
MTAVAPDARLEALIKAQAYGLGFDLAGITRLGPAETADEFREWLTRGYAGDMAYLERGADTRGDTTLPFAGATSAIVVGLNYGGTTPSGPIARYARGDDYHEIMWGMLDTLHAWIDDHLGFATRGRSYVDTAPILERDLARRAGLGWQAKNTNLINPSIGSFFFIGSLFIDLDLDPDTPFEADRCGTCTRCIEACPTAAIVEPRVLDATRCISYLTIETKGAIPLELREGIGDRLYGCDVCQDVCPWNVSFAKELSSESLKPRDWLEGDARTIARSILAMDEDAFRETFKGSAMKRAKLRGLKRDAAVVLGNVGTSEDVDVLVRALEDREPLVHEHAAWAIERLTAMQR